jgi:hypothetical protein
MERQAIEKRLLSILPAAWIAEFLSAFRQTDEIGDSVRRFLLEQAANNVALRRLKHSIRSRLTCQRSLLRLNLPVFGSIELFGVVITNVIISQPRHDG